MPAWRFDQPMLTEQEIVDLIARYALKLAWFAKAGYVPHYYQLLFHTASTSLEKLCRFRHLVAGRRGGKTLSAAWEVLYYLLHPEEFHWDYHGTKDDTPLYAWALAKDHPTGLASLTTFRKCLRDAGLENGVDYKEHKGNRWFEFPNGSFIHFRSAEDPQSLRGAGLDILWIDEAAFIPTRDALDVSRPAMSEKRGMLITTTTPDGKNWLYHTFFQGGVLNDPEHARVEYRSLDNPYFPEEEWVYMANPENYHPLLFRREYLAAFDAMAGKELPGDWLKYWVEDVREHPVDLIVPKLERPTGDKPHGYDLNIWLGIDPAISLSDEADRFAITALGVTEGAQGFILDQWAGRIAFPDQIDLIMEWYIRWKPIYIAVEVQAFQRAIEQQLTRIEGIPNIIPMFAKGKKEERILSMAPLFKAGKVRINRKENDFINEWVDYDSTKKNPADDCLDSAEIAIRAAGIWLPSVSQAPDTMPHGFGSMEELAWSRIPKEKKAEDWKGVDEHLGGDW